MIEREFFKTDLAFERQVHWVPEIADIAVKFLVLATAMGVEHPYISESVTTFEEDQRVQREHDQHRRCVAFDGGVHGWTSTQITDMISMLNKIYASVAYETGSGKSQVAFCHDNGNGLHFHVAVHSRFKKPEFKG